MSNSEWSAARHLVLVPCHAIYTGGASRSSLGEWCRSSFYDEAELAVFDAHIRAAARIAHEQADSMLVFSGGQTRREAGPMSEAQSYFFFALHRGIFDDFPDVIKRTTTEEFARDSMENVYFSMQRFRECSGHIPESVRAVGWPFKEARFHAHAAALDAPLVQYIGLGVPATAPDKVASGERAVRDAFEADPFGASGALLEKKRQRNPFQRHCPYPLLAGMPW